MGIMYHYPPAINLAKIKQEDAIHCVYDVLSKKKKKTTERKRLNGFFI